MNVKASAQGRQGLLPDPSLEVVELAGSFVLLLVSTGPALPNLGLFRSILVSGSLVKVG